MIRLYDKYFVDMTLSNVSTRVHFTCAYCDHNEDEGPEKKHTDYPKVVHERAVLYDSTCK